MDEQARGLTSRVGPIEIDCPRAQRVSSLKCLRAWPNQWAATIELTSPDIPKGQEEQRAEGL